MSKSFHPLTIPLANGVTPVHAFWAEDDAVLALGDGAEVTSWTNRGSNGTAATGTTGAVPTLTLDGINGRPALSFNGAGQHLDVSSGTVAQPGTVVCVMSDDVAQSNTVYDGFGAGSQWLYQSWTNNGYHRINLGSSSPDTGAGTAAHDTAYVSVLVANDPDNVIRLNGTSYAIGSSGTESMVGLVLGQNRFGSDGWDGKIAMVYVFDSDVTTAPWFREWELGLRGHYNTDTVPQPAAGIGRILYTIFEEDFTLTTSGTLADGTPGVDEAGNGWGGSAGDWDYSADGSGIDVPEGDNSYVHHDTNGREDVQQTVRFTMAVGGSSGRTNGRIFGRSAAGNVNNGLLLLWVCNGATTDADLSILDVDTSTTLHTWDISALAEQIDEGDDVELVVWWVGNDIVLRSVTVNGTHHQIGSRYTLTGTPATAHGAGSGRDQYGMGNAERVVSSSIDRTTYYKLESLAGL